MRTIAEHRCLATLCILVGPCRGTSNEIVLINLLESIGMSSAKAELRESLSDLEKVGALRQDWHEALLVVHLTPRGAEIAKGTISVNGIASPGIDCPYWTME